MTHRFFFFFNFGFFVPLFDGTQRRDDTLKNYLGTPNTDEFSHLMSEQLLP